MTTNSTEGSFHPEDLLSMYALAALPEEAEREVEAHLDGCPSCRTDLASLEATAARLATAAVVRTPPDGLRARLLEQVGRGEKPGATGRAGAAVPVPAARRLLVAAGQIVGPFGRNLGDFVDGFVGREYLPRLDD